MRKRRRRSTTRKKSRDRRRFDYVQCILVVLTIAFAALAIWGFVTQRPGFDKFIKPALCLGGMACGVNVMTLWKLFR